MKQHVIEYRAGDDVLQVDYPSESEIKWYLTRENRDAVAAVFKVDLFDESTREVTGGVLELAARELLGLLDGLIRYTLSYDIIPCVPIKDADGTGGIQINGKRMNIEAGLGRCMLQRGVETEYKIGGDTVFQFVDERDLRDETEIQCDTGPITITKKPVRRVRTAKALAQILEFAARHSNERIEIGIREL